MISKTFSAFAVFLLTAPIVIAQQSVGFTPRNFSAQISSFGHVYSVEFQDGALFYTDTDGEHPPEPVQIMPSTEQWREFRTTLDAIRVWTWRETYNSADPDLTQRTTWFLNIEYSDKSVKTSGNNSFPDIDGKAKSGEPTAYFLRYSKAVEKLVEGRQFGWEKRPRPIGP